MNDNSHRARHERHDGLVGTGPANVGVLELQIDQERIARRAYGIYESRNRVDGHADDDWFQAAAEYATRLDSQRSISKHGSASSSLADRVRNARR